MNALSVCLLVASVVGAPAAKKLRYEAEAVLGVEYDSNATRLDSDNTSGKRVDAGLLRGQGHFTVSYRPAADLVLAASYDLAGKVFFVEDARGQDALIHRLTAAMGLRLGDSLAAKIGGLYHEGFQRSPADGATAGAGLFDFRLLDGRLQLAVAPSRAVVGAVALGARRFTYKPDPALSFDAVLGSVSIDTHHTLGKGKRESELDMSLVYTLSSRVFSDEREQLCVAHIPGCEVVDSPETGQVVTFPYPASTRRDLVHRLSLELTWVRGVLISGGYEYAASRSNSFGFGYQSHELRAKVVTPLFAKIYGTAQVRARLLYYESNTVVLDNPGFEEENRSHVLVQLERALHGGLSLVLRYTLFVGDLRAPDVASLRHLVFLGCAYRYRSR